MSKTRDLFVYLDDILTAIADAAEFTQGMSFEMFAEDKKTINAVLRTLEVLGEATKHIPLSFRKKYPAIPWTNMAGMRDVLIHNYMGVDLKTVWKVIQERLPELKPLLEEIKAKRA